MAKNNEERQQTDLHGNPVDNEDDEDEQELNDFNEEMPWYETKGGYRRDVMSSLFQKAVRRSDAETAAFAAWELVRSGPKYESHYWSRAILVCVEDLVAGNEATEHVLRYEELAKNRWEDNGWARRLCAIAAALVCARAQPSRETTHANGYFSNTMVDRARVKQDDDHEPLYEPPVTEEELDPDGEIGFVTVDKHTYPGAGKGRGWPHFRLHGARIGPHEDTVLGKKFRRRVLEYDQPEYSYREPEVAFSEKEIEHALEPTTEDAPWRCEFDTMDTLDEFEDEN
ncbi:hypothetical protein [Natrarchaeobius oligotrophus]|uniref:MgsA AAA+ ATPase C-terminal domain-containing protein n=1 Tax=Natrarchaeobius chitinivorans TaxID=1679083 RepID=A0A3N6LXQ0_NATCH|nr:hypothetical protein [Natrarchaeobius chitinivorans]RQG95563.1 hypothetical protein EA472_21585 [Natrarchaeobius chitinivorans]